jgi:ribonuclease BN (tRNA processing enzyme)
VSSINCTVIGHWGAYPGPGEATSCYLLRSGGTSVLLDCGSGALAVLQGILPLHQVDAVILSHYHADHIADIGCLQYAALIDTDLGRRHTVLPIYGHAESDRFASLSYRGCTVGVAYDAGSEVRVGPFSFTFAPTIHPDPCYAVKAKVGASTLVYSGDSGASDSLTGFAKGADVLLCEASLYEAYRGKIPGHMSSGEAGRMARQAGVGKLVITHLPHFGDHADLLAEARAAFGGETVMATRGLELEV